MESFASVGLPLHGYIGTAPRLRRPSALAPRAARVRVRRAASRAAPRRQHNRASRAAHLVPGSLRRQHGCPRRTGGAPPVRPRRQGSERASAAALPVRRARKRRGAAHSRAGRPSPLRLRARLTRAPPMLHTQAAECGGDQAARAAGHQVQRNAARGATLWAPGLAPPAVGLKLTRLARVARRWRCRRTSAASSWTAPTPSTGCARRAAGPRLVCARGRSGR